METNMTLFTQCFIFFAVLVPAGAIYVTLRRETRTQNMNPRMIDGVALAFLLYYAIVGVLAARGTLLDFSRFPPSFALAVIVLPLAAFFTISFLPATRRLLSGIPTGALIAFQGYRVLAEALILLLIRD